MLESFGSCDTSSHIPLCPLEHRVYLGMNSSKFGIDIDAISNPQEIINVDSRLQTIKDAFASTFGPEAPPMMRSAVLNNLGELSLPLA